MALPKTNLEKMKQRFEALNSPSQGFTKYESNFLNIPEGRSLVRLLGAKAEGEEALVEVYTHRNLGTNKEKCICLRHTPSINQPCAICDYISQLYASKSPENQEIAKKMLPQLQVYANSLMVTAAGMSYVYDFSKVWIVSFGKEIFHSLLGYLDNPAWGDVFSWDSGRVFTVTKNKKPNSEYYDTKYAPDPILSNLGTEEFIQANIVPKMNDLAKIFLSGKNRRTPEEMRYLLNNGVFPAKAKAPKATPATTPVVQPVVAPTPQPVQPIAQPVVQPAPVVEPVAEVKKPKASKPAPVVEPVVAPVVEPVVAQAVEVTTDAVPQPVAVEKPSNLPVDKQACFGKGYDSLGPSCIMCWDFQELCMKAKGLV